LISGAFAKPCGFVGTATRKWDDNRIVAISLGTDAYDLADRRPEIFTRKAGKDWISIHNRPEDLEWAEQKIRWLFSQTGGPCPPVCRRVISISLTKMPGHEKILKPWKGT
jgi:hypothetical protein